MGVIVGTVTKVDTARGLIEVGRTQLRAPNQVALGGIAPGTSVTITCEERDGEYWVTAIRQNVF
jgi:hypothetical protein